MIRLKIPEKSGHSPGLRDSTTSPWPLHSLYIGNLHFAHPLVGGLVEIPPTKVPTQGCTADALLESWSLISLKASRWNRIPAWYSPRAARASSHSV